MTALARHVHRCGTSVNVTRVTECLLIRFKDCSTERKSFLVLQSSQEFVARGPRGEPTDFILLNGHDLKIPSNYMPSYPYVSRILSPHQGKVFT